LHLWHIQCSNTRHLFLWHSQHSFKPSHSSLLSCSASAPHLYQDIAEELYPWDTLPSPSYSQGQEELFFCELEIFLQHNQVSQRFPNSIVRRLPPIQLLPHKSPYVDFVLFISQVSSSRLPRFIPCERL